MITTKLYVSIFKRTKLYYQLKINRLQACLYLRWLPSFGNILARKLLTHCKTPEAIFESDPQDFLAIDGIGTFHLQHFKKWRSLETVVLREEETILKNNIKTLFLGDPNYPKTLSFCPDAPLVLFYKGDIAFKDQKIISIVGTRANNAYGRKICQQLIEELQPIHPIIVSGFAYGIDIIAHKQALKLGLSTIACMGHGLNQLYPSEHQKYAKKVLENGGFVSDFTTADTFDRKNFLIRNRLIAGLAHATVIVQSDYKGGSMNTANYAHQYNRELFAFPGPVDQPLHRGCHQLIKTQQAQLISNGTDLIKSMGWWQNDNQEKAVQKQLFVELTDAEKVIFAYLKDRTSDSLDNIAIATKNTVSDTASTLLQLEMKGCIRPLAGKRFEWIY